MPALSPEQIERAIATTLADFLPYQRRYIADQHRFVLVEKAVRTGFTYAHSFKKFIQRVTRDPRRKQLPEVYTAKNLISATEYVGYMRKWAEWWNELHGETVIDLSTWNQELCRLPGGNIRIMSSDPNAFRGMEADITCDEFAIHEQQDQLYSSAQSRIQWVPDGQVTLISSHSHPETTFMRLANEWRNLKSRDRVVHRVTLEDACEEGLHLKVPGPHLEKRNGTYSGEVRCREAFIRSIKKTCLSDEDYRREYMCEPASLSALIASDVYDKCVLPPYDVVPDTLDHAKRYRELFVGGDCGRTHDLTVFWALERGYNNLGQTCYLTRCVKSIRNQPFPVQHEMVKPIVTHGDVGFGFIDQGVQGRALADSVVEETGSIIQPLNFTAPAKAQMAERLRAFAQTRRISFPSDPKIKQDMLSVRRMVSDQRTLKYDGGTRDSHGDFFWACAAALHAAEHQFKAQLMLPEQDEAAAA